jgi:ATP-binding cassette subfamily C protein LapB
MNFRPSFPVTSFWLVEIVTLKQNLAKRWFYSAFAQGKWLYIQVILAATMSNFLGVSTSIFVMVVYDRVVPNEGD